MKRIPLFVFAAACVIGAAPFAAGGANKENRPILGIEIPVGYREWELIGVAHEAADLNDLRAVLGNAVAMKAFRGGTLPFPDGTIIARLAWKMEASAENNAVFGRSQSFVPGAPTEGVQFMIKDSKKYASTGGWGFAQFTDGKPDNVAINTTCFSCHEPAKAHDEGQTRQRIVKTNR
jgi:hypothetical protein